MTPWVSGTTHTLRPESGSREHWRFYTGIHSEHFLLPLRGVYATTGKYVVRKTGEFYDNMYIQPIYKTRGKAENMGMAGRCASMMTENDAQEKGRVLT